MLLRTLRIALVTCAVSIPIAYPLAIVLARGGPFWSRLVLYTVISPLLVLVVVRAYGWKLILAKQGFLSWLIKGVGLWNSPPALLYTEWAVVIASAHVFMPFLVLPLAGAIGKIEPAVEEAARTLGAARWTMFRRIVVPLSLPGLAVGVTLVFSLTASAYLMPQILGGNFAAMLGTLVQQQILSVNDWPFAALATILLAMTLLANLVLLWLFERRFGRWVGRGGGAVTMTGSISVPLALCCTLLMAAILAPLAIPVAVSISDSLFVSFPPKGFTWRWYGQVLVDREFRTTFLFSVQLAFIVTGLSVLLGVPCAVGLTRFKFPGDGRFSPSFSPRSSFRSW